MASSNISFPPGAAAVKAQYLISVESRTIPDDDAAEDATSHTTGNPHRGNREEGASGRNLTGAQRKKALKESKKKQKGSNKGRRWVKTRDDLELCWRVASGTVCEYGSECRFTHDIDAYLAAKPRDIRIPAAADLQDTVPFVRSNSSEDDAMGGDQEQPSVDFSTICPIFAEMGECRFGLKCRFLGGHVRKAENGTLELVTDEEKKAHAISTAREVNFIDADTLKKVRNKKYPCPVTEAYLKEIQTVADEGAGVKAENGSSVDNGGSSDVVIIREPDQDEPENVSNTADAGNNDQATHHDHDKSQDDTPDVPMRFSEKKRLHWRGKSYLAPLTTVGNLPFRRLCVSLGAEITCGEMGLANSFLQGSKEEWSLVRRHPSESIFGVQLAGSKPALLVPAAEIIAKECAGSLDFVDLNCGCPIDLVFKTGSGSALLDAAGRLGKILVGMNKALGEVPLTVKLRTGVKEGRNTVHKIMPRISTEWNASCITLHGRTRQQRYSKLADWDYIKECVETVRAREADEDLPPVPIFGGGDCFSSHDYWSRIEQSGVDGVMVGRGALIKPWIFTEIGERREWDISSRERLELIRKYAEFGLSHFGSDTAGVNTTRRYLCEALSFQYRYIPIGILEQPSRINDRPPAFRGRDELETLLASSDSNDWVKISEMFLGPSPESWTFTPKHKSNAHGSEEAQG